MASAGEHRLAYLEKVVADGREPHAVEAQRAVEHAAARGLVELDERGARRIAAVHPQLSDLQTKQEALRAQLVGRYAALATKVSGSQSTLSFLQAQISAWNGKSN